MHKMRAEGLEAVAIDPFLYNRARKLLCGNTRPYKKDSCMVKYTRNKQSRLLSSRLTLDIHTAKLQNIRRLWTIVCHIANVLDYKRSQKESQHTDKAN